MTGSEREELHSLYARLSDLGRVAASGSVAVSLFLSPRELYFAEQYQREQGIAFLSFGGCEGTERQRLYLLPDYMEDVTSPEGLLDYGYDHGIRTLEILGSGYRRLTHRDFLGSLLGLGLERGVIGDICLVDEFGGYAFVDAAIAPFITESLTKVASDTVKVRETTLPADFQVLRRTVPILDTVASPRLDAVVAALCSCSREQASSAVQSGLVELNYRTEEKGDRAVMPPAMISVRGQGKFRVLAVSELTRKGRIRLVAEKYL